MVQDTSIETYKQILKEGLVGQLQAVVLRCIMDNNNITDKEIHSITHLDINCVTGRRNELVELGLVESNGKRKCSVSGRTVYQWRIMSSVNIDAVRENVYKPALHKNLVSRLSYCAKPYKPKII